MGLITAEANAVVRLCDASTGVHIISLYIRRDDAVDVPVGAYVDALDKLGLDGTAVAVMITAERYARNEIRQTAGAHFVGMIAKAKRDEPDLARSLWGFRVEQLRSAGDA